MSLSNEALYLFNTETQQRLNQEIESDGMDIYFPSEVSGWTEVLDCRVEPYLEKSIEENCDFAIHVRKKYILVTESQAKAIKLPSSD